VTPRSPYLVGPAYDWAFFLLPPLVGLVLGIFIAGTPFTDEVVLVNDEETTLAAVCIGSLIHAHLVAVFFRSHGNPSIFRLYPVRFLIVPPVLYLAIVGSTWFAITATVAVTFWDVWHSGAQTFGFARIYDRNAGNPPELGRRLDYWLNQLLYAGPILAGATMMDHLEVLEDYDDVGATFFASIPARADGASRWITIAVLAAGTAFVAFYLAYYALLRKRGYRVPFLKVYLLAATGLCSIYTWGFNSWGEAFFIMNFFHAVQYLALVWATERKTIIARARLGGRRRAGALAALLFFGSVFAYGVWAELLDADLEYLWAATIVVSLMHFWYDGFVWSVRRREV
jgi:hypothetical protein